MQEKNLRFFSCISTYIMCNGILTLLVRVIRLVGPCILGWWDGRRIGWVLAAIRRVGIGWLSRRIGLLGIRLWWVRIGCWLAGIRLLRQGLALDRVRLRWSRIGRIVRISRTGSSHR